MAISPNFMARKVVFAIMPRLKLNLHWEDKMKLSGEAVLKVVYSIQGIASLPETI
jgi:hypothetical protein